MRESRIVEAGRNDISVVYRLFVEYQQWLDVDLCFQGFEEELASLPGSYAPPGGAIFLAFDRGDAVGCVAVRPRTAREAELKRLYVRSLHRGHRLGSNLIDTAMARAIKIGYQSIVLDTLPQMRIAKALYIAKQFKPIPPYYPNPEPGAEYFRCDFAEV